MSQHKDIMVFGIYSRKSKWTGKGESIENQIQLCKDYVNSKYQSAVAEIVFKIYEDEGFSGKNTARPCYQKMMKDIRERELDCVVCYRLDRISRSAGDFARTIEEFQHYKVDFICIKEQFDTGTPMGKAMMNIAAVFAQLERETIGERIRDNMLLLARTGRWLGGTTPLGFGSAQVERIVDDGKFRTSHQLVPVKGEIHLVELIFGKFLETQSIEAVESFLLKQGVQTRNGKNYTATALKEILSNPTYCAADEEAYHYFVKYNCIMGCEKAAFDGIHGVSAYHRTSNEGGYQSPRPMNQWIIAAGKHMGVVPSAKWIKAQKILYKNRRYQFQYHPKNKTNLLSGLLWCGNCGAQMRPRINSHSEPDENGQKEFSYLCDLKRKSNGKRCAAVNLPGNELDRMVCDLLLGYSRVHGGVIHNKIVELETQIGFGNTTLHKRIEVAKDGITDKENEVRGIIRLLGRDTDHSVLFQQMQIQAQRLSEEIQQQRRALAQLEEEKIAAVSFDAQIKRTMRALETFKDTFHYATIEEKRELIHSMVERIEWDGRKVHIFLFGEGRAQCC